MFGTKMQCSKRMSTLVQQNKKIIAQCLNNDRNSFLGVAGINMMNNEANTAYSHSKFLELNITDFNIYMILLNKHLNGNVIRIQSFQMSALDCLGFQFEQKRCDLAL